MKIICYFFRHSWKYKSVENKHDFSERTCQRCKENQVLNKLFDKWEHK